MSTKDKRNSEKVIYYSPAPTSEEQSGDLQQILSFVLGFVGMIFKQKICLWISLFSLLSCFANIKSTSDVKQMIINAGVILMGMVQMYYQYPKFEEQQRLQAEAAAAASATLNDSVADSTEQ